MRTIFMLLAITLFLYAFDTDLDGIDDKNDFCPQTPFWKVVDASGCEEQKALPFNGEFRMGATLARINHLDAAKYFADLRIYHKEWTLLGYFSKISIDDTAPKTLDAVVSLGKTIFENRNIKTKLSATLYLPTYYNKKTDKGFKLSAYFKRADVMFAYRYRDMAEFYDTHTFLFEYYLRFGKHYVAPFFYLESASAKKGLWYRFYGALLHIERQRLFFDLEFLKIANEGLQDSYTATFSVGFRF